MQEIAVIGGGLQGIEITYLATQAGYRTLLVDRKAEVPARGLADDFFQADITSADQELLARLSQADIVFPACENYQALEKLSSLRGKLPPLVFDLAAYQISSSKKKSKEFFRRAGLPCARDWPAADFPLIIKPEQGSGSESVELITSREELENLQEKPGSGEFIAEEYLQGPSYSLEVIACENRVYPLKVTRLVFDQKYDCRQVLAGDFIPADVCHELIDLGRTAARELSLNGIMDLEVIAADSGLKLLEIDARFPSQTPSAVYHAWGINMVKLLVELYLENESRELHSARIGAALYEQLLVRNQQLYNAGEHIMTEAGSLRYRENFLGADSALTDFALGCKEWRAILHFKNDNITAVKRRRKAALNRIRSRLAGGGEIQPDWN